MNDSTHTFPGHRFALAVLFVALLLAGVWSFVVHLGNLSTPLAESGAQTNVIRVSGLLNGNPDSPIIVGSSLSGRLLPSFFEGGKVTNFALDGGSAIDGLQILLKLNKYPKTVFVEENSLARAIAVNHDFLLGAAASPQMFLSRSFPAMKPEFRPSSVAYFHLKTGIDSMRSGVSVDASEDLKRARQQIVDADGSAQHNREEFLRLAELLHQKGSDIHVFRMPDGAGAFAEIDLSNVPAYISVTDFKELYLERFGSPKYSDGLHLALKDARQFSQLILDYYRDSFTNLNSSPTK